MTKVIVHTFPTAGPGPFTHPYPNAPLPYPPRLPGPSDLSSLTEEEEEEEEEEDVAPVKDESLSLLSAHESTSSNVFHTSAPIPVPVLLPL